MGSRLNPQYEHLTAGQRSQIGRQYDDRYDAWRQKWGYTPPISATLKKQDHLVNVLGRKYGVARRTIKKILFGQFV